MSLKSAFLTGFVAGFALLLAAAAYAPLVHHSRVRAHVSVQTNGGRAEEFVIRMPDDRIVAAGSAALAPAGISWPVDLHDSGIQVEQFKLRDTGGAVVGVAARHEERDSAGDRVAWVLFLPARGALLMRQTAPDTEGPGEVVGGTGEFSRLHGQYREVWEATGKTPAGQPRGTLTLKTVVEGMQ